MFWLLLLIILLVLVCLISIDIFKYQEFEKIPGPRGIFLFGNTFDFLLNSVEAFKYLFTLTAKYKDFFKLKLGPIKFVVISNPEDTEIVLSDSKFNMKGTFIEFLRPWLRDGLILSNGQKWHQRRKLLTPAFHFDTLRHYTSILIERSNDLTKRLKSELDYPKTELYPYLTDYSLYSVIESVMGVVLDKEEADAGKGYKSSVHKLGSYLFYRISKVWLHPNMTFNLTTMGQDQKRRLDLMTLFRDKVITKRRKGDFDIKMWTESINENEEDIFLVKKKRLAMLDLLLQVEKEGKIDIQGIGEEVDSFIFAGFGTISISLQYAFMLLANHQSAQDKILEECSQILISPDSTPTLKDLAMMKYLEACIKETLRLYPPAYIITRTCDKPVQFKKYKCPPGIHYLIAIYELHRRSDQFDEPLKFRPERFLKEPTWHPFSYIPFSAGPRNCIGQKFAMIEMKLAILAVLREYRLLPITKPEDIVLYMDMLLRSKEPIYVKLEKRSNK